MTLSNCTYAVLSFFFNFFLSLSLSLFVSLDLIVDDVDCTLSLLMQAVLRSTGRMPSCTTLVKSHVRASRFAKGVTDRLTASGLSL